MFFLLLFLAAGILIFKISVDAATSAYKPLLTIKIESYTLGLCLKSWSFANLLSLPEINRLIFVLCV